MARVERLQKLVALCRVALSGAHWSPPGLGEIVVPCGTVIVVLGAISIGIDEEESQHAPSPA
jgi:hypothetical protein